MPKIPRRIDIEFGSKRVSRKYQNKRSFYKVEIEFRYKRVVSLRGLSTD